jgi:hypothetical protein
VNHRKPRVQTPVVSRYHAPAPVHDFVLLFLPPCGPHLTPLAIGSLESGLLVSPLLGGPTRHRPFAPTLHLHQRKSSRNLHLQYWAKSQSTPRCQSLITARSDHPPVLERFGPHFGHGEAAAPAGFRRAGRAPGRRGSGARPHAHLGRRGGRGSSGGGSGEGMQRRPVVVAAVARVTARGGAWLGNARLLEL